MFFLDTEECSNYAFQDKVKWKYDILGKQMGGKQTLNPRYSSVYHGGSTVYRFLFQLKLNAAHFIDESSGNQ